MYFGKKKGRAKCIDNIKTLSKIKIEYNSKKGDYYVFDATILGNGKR